MSKRIVNAVQQKSLSYFELLRQGVIAGIGWAIGVTIGFVLISTLLAFTLRSLGGLPLIGAWIANIVEATQVQLVDKGPSILKVDNETN